MFVRELSTCANFLAGDQSGRRMEKGRLWDSMGTLVDEAELMLEGSSSSIL